MSIPLDPRGDPPRPPHPLHNHHARATGHRTVRRWTIFGLAGVLGLTAVTAGLAFEVSSTQDAARRAVVNQAQAAYRKRLSVEDANLATVRRESVALNRTLAHERTLLVAREHTRQLALAAQSAAQARARAVSAASVLVSATRPSAPTTTTTPRVTARSRDDSASATSGGS